MKLEMGKGGVNAMQTKKTHCKEFRSVQIQGSFLCSQSSIHPSRHNCEVNVNQGINKHTLWSFPVAKFSPRSYLILSLITYVQRSHLGMPNCRVGSTLGSRPSYFLFFYFFVFLFLLFAVLLFLCLFLFIYHIRSFGSLTVSANALVFGWGIYYSKVGLSRHFPTLYSV